MLRALIKPVCAHARKGWTAAAAEDIAQGKFVCQYAGELITIAESERRLAIYDRLDAPCTGHALLVHCLPLPVE